MNLILSRTLFVLICSLENKQSYLLTHSPHYRHHPPHPPPSMRACYSRSAQWLLLPKRLKVKVNCIMEVKYDCTAYKVASYSVWSGGGWGSGSLCKSALRQSGWSPPGQHMLDRWSHFHRWLGVTMSPWSGVMRRILAPALHPTSPKPRPGSSSERAERASTLVFNLERVNINQEVHLRNSIHRCRSHCIAIR